MRVVLMVDVDVFDLNDEEAVVSNVVATEAAVAAIEEALAHAESRGFIQPHSDGYGVSIGGVSYLRNIDDCQQQP